MIEVKKLVKTYGNHPAVKNISFTVETGKIVGFLGPNGAGKSTTMNMIAGYTAPTGGQVLVNGIDVWKNPEKAKRQIGYLPEIPPLYPDMRVQEYLSFVAELKKVSWNKRSTMIPDIMKDTRLNEVAGRLIGHLSKGYKQRVGLAGAMIGYPDILLLDEPTVGLDPGQIIEMRDLIRELGKEHTILLSSHIMQEIDAVCDEIIIINEGEVVVCDTPENLTLHLDSEGVHLIIQGEEEVIKGALRNVSGIRDVIYDRQMEPGTLGLTLYSREGRDLREDVFFALAEARCPIMQMNRMEASLEEVFLKLTGNQPAGSVQVRKAAQSAVPDREVGELQDAAPTTDNSERQDAAPETDGDEIQQEVWGTDGKEDN